MDQLEAIETKLNNFDQHMKFSENLECTSKNPQDNNEKRSKDTIEEEIEARLNEHYEDNVLMPIKEKYVEPKKLRSKLLIFIYA